MVVILYGTETANYIHLGPSAAENTHYFKKSLCSVGDLIKIQNPPFSVANI